MHVLVKGRNKGPQREKNKGDVIFSVEGISFGGYRYVHTIRPKTPEYFQYHFCKWHCVLPALQNPVVSPTTQSQSPSSGSPCEGVPGVPAAAIAIRRCKAPSAAPRRRDAQPHTGLQVFGRRLHCSTACSSSAGHPGSQLNHHVLDVFNLLSVTGIGLGAV